MPRDIARFLPVKPDVLMILLAVNGQPEHGYAIMKAVEQRTGGAVRLQTGALYRALKRLLDDGLIDECGPSATLDDHDDRRRFYRTTRLGAAVVEAELDRMETIVRSARAKRGAPSKQRPGLA